ncbi:hypothetical protein [Roseovarius sp. Pro17]|uniref:hypothetical protein n=1 Tax=Roseovarius sp. Pro17 TaxID=3108175 RepID=UPI002D776EC2|nr:hypothetical protein [Roseovarius sp. Pro17]
MKFRTVSIALATLTLASPAAALSCLPHDLARTYQRIHAAPESYIAVYGTLDFDASQLPEVDMANQQATPPETRIPARFSGEALGQIGFTRPFAGPVTLRALCFGPWCAQPPAGGNVLAFVQQGEDGYSLTVDPCGGDAFFAPAPELLDKVHRCFTGDACQPENPLQE